MECWEKTSLGRMDKIFEILGIITLGEFPPPQALQLCLDRMFNVLAEKRICRLVSQWPPGLDLCDVLKELYTWILQKNEGAPRGPKCSLQFVS